MVPDRPKQGECLLKTAFGDVIATTFGICADCWTAMACTQSEAVYQQDCSLIEFDRSGKGCPTKFPADVCCQDY